MTGGKAGVWPECLRAAALAAAGGYGRLIAARNRAYERGWLSQHDLGRATISVGNLTVGGTGKTPVVAWLVRRLAEAGHQPAVLLRGYRGEREGVGSDEAVELSGLFRGVSGVSVWPDPDRVRAAAAVLSQQPATDVFVLDDGMQHRRVRRDLEVVLVSATQGLSGGHVLPRGLLREKPEGLARADVVVLTRVESGSGAEVLGLESEVRRYVREGTAVVRCRHGVSGIETDAGEHFSAARVAGRRVFLVAGTGDPESFGRTARGLGAEVAGHWWGRDHHRYAPADWAEIGRQARAAGAQLILTTGKDFAKLRQLGPTGAAAEGTEGLPVWVVRVEVTFWDDGAEVLMERAHAAIRGYPNQSGRTGG